MLLLKLISLVGCASLVSAQSGCVDTSCNSFNDFSASNLADNCCCILNAMGQCATGDCVSIEGEPRCSTPTGGGGGGGGCVDTDCNSFTDESASNLADNCCCIGSGMCATGDCLGAEPRCVTATGGGTVSSPSDPPTPPAPPPMPPGASMHQDPHIKFANGGAADFRGEDKKTFAMCAAPGFLVNAETRDRDFRRWGGQLVHGSFITRVFAKLRSSLTGALMCVAVFAEIYDKFRVYDCDATTAGESGYKNSTRVENLVGVEAMQMSGGRFYAHASGWEVFVRRRRLRKPILGKDGEAPPGSGCLPELDFWGKTQCFFLDTSFKVLDGDDDKVALFGKSTLGVIAPHGIVGQSFDGSHVAVSGKQDDYGNGPVFTTSAQAEGAIEGTYKDYIMPTPFATAFKYGRFDAIEPIAPRNVSALSGFKTAGTGGTSAGSTELHGADE